MSQQTRFVWDYAMTDDEFAAILAGAASKGRLDRDWAAVRVIEYGRYADIVRLIGFRALVENWPRWRERVRADDRKRAFDFLTQWLPVHHPELV